MVQHWYLWWRLQPYLGVPFPWGQYSDFVQKLVHTCQQVLPVTSFVCHIMKHLGTMREGEKESRGGREG